MDMERLVFDVREAARVLSISPWTIRRYITDGKLRPIRIGRRVLIEPSEGGHGLGGAFGRQEGKVMASAQRIEFSGDSQDRNLRAEWPREAGREWWHTRKTGREPGAIHSPMSRSTVYR